MTTKATNMTLGSKIKFKYSLKSNMFPMACKADISLKLDECVTVWTNDCLWYEDESKVLVCESLRVKSNAKIYLKSVYLLITWTTLTFFGGCLYVPL